MYKNFRVSEEEKKQILEMHQSNGYNAASNLINEQGGQDPAWIKQSDSNLNFTSKAKMGIEDGTQATYVAGGSGDDSFVIIIPKGSKFKVSPSGSFLLSIGYLVSKTALFQNGLQPATLFTDNLAVSKALHSGKLNARAVNIAGTVDGNIIYEGGSTAFRLPNTGEALSQRIQKSFA
jgi:hypothetical protein